MRKVGRKHNNSTYFSSWNDYHFVVTWSSIILLYKRLKFRKKVCQDFNLCRYETANNLWHTERHRLRNDIVDFVPLLEQSIRLAPVGTVVADEGYDSE